MALVIGVTGSIATGKSSACHIMTELGATHCEVDKLVHRLYEPGQPAFDRVVALFGEEVIGADGSIDRCILGSKVFGHPTEMAKLTTAIGGFRDAAVKDVIDAWHVSLAPTDVALLETVNLIEAGYSQWCYQVWLIVSEEAIARQRLMARNHLTLAEANQRLASQRPWLERAAAADVILFNNGCFEAFASRVRVAFARAQDLWSRHQLARRSEGAKSHCA